MDIFSSMRVSASGMTAQQKRMNTISSNLANVDTVQTAEGGPYKRKDPIFTASEDRENFSEILGSEMDGKIQGVEVTEIHEDEQEPRKVFNPSHPMANKDGYVSMPNVNSVEEMANIISASRSYEANVSALNAAKSMAIKALEIGK